MDCVFCRIVGGEIPSRRMFEDAEIVAFHDIAPQAPAHALVLPRRHVASLDELDDPALAGRLLLVAAQVARDLGLGGGYRVVVNTGPDGGQTVGHLHLHVLGGRQMTWPPG
jgi:histidine triad (HIT) family protein